MREELDSKLCGKYPLIFAQRHKPMQETCMCWGFECDDGWYNIIDQLCGNIQWHIDGRLKDIAYTKKRNQMIADARAGDFTMFEDFYKGYLPDVRESRKQEVLLEKLQEPAEPIHQLEATQVKEKFGTLSFYYYGGDELISGMIYMAEAMSSVTCEVCGNPGKRTGIGWIRTTCKEHTKEGDWDEE